MTSVWLCGELRVELDGRRVERELPARQGRLLFGYLVLHRGRAVRREELIEALWPERPPRDPHAALTSVLARLRRVVGHERLPARGSVRLLLGDEAWIDEEAARAAAPDARSALDGGQLDRALALATEALGVIDQPLLAEFEREWLDERRRALADLVAPLVDVAANAGVALGGAALDKAELLARRGVEQEPFRESTHAALMCVLAAKGDSAEALRAYDALRVRLRDELGAAPSRALIALYERLFTDEPAPVESADAAPAPSRDSTDGERTTVPAPPSPLLGRGRELDRLRALLDAKDVRLVTVVGPGGVGKTRLAVELARELMASGANVTWVALAPIRAADDVGMTIARALEVTPAGGESIEAALPRVLAARDLLLVLDNYEHLTPAAPLVAELLARAPRLNVLVTSREPLHVRAERVFRLAPLKVPPGDIRTDELTTSPATALFLATAMARDSELELTGEDASAVAEICRRVDGLPLAIELAAGRLGVLSAQELAVQVRDDGLEPLTLAARDAPGRHRSLRETLAWSHHLLAKKEQTAFARFAVFAGGADPNAAHAITGADVGVLQALVDKHLLTITVDRDGARRLDMLETVRRFASEQLDSEGDVEQLAARHADYFLELAEEAAPDLRRRAPPELFRKLDLELHNLRAAMTWALEHNRPEQSLRLAVALEQYWAMYGPDEGVRWLQAGLEDGRDRLPAALLAQALTALSAQLGVLGAGREAERIAREAAAAALATDDRAVRVDALLELTNTLLVQHRAGEAHTVALEAVVLASATGDPALVADARLMEASCAPSVSSAMQAAEAAAAHFERVGHASRLLDLYGTLAELALAHGDDAAASTFIERAKDAAQRVPAKRERIWVLGSEGRVLLLTGDRAGARRAFGRELALAERLSVQEALPEALYGLAAISAADGPLDVAARLRGAAEALAPEPVHPAIATRIEQQCFEAARRRLGQARWDTALAAGRQLGFAETLQLARAALADLSSTQGGRAGVQ